MNSWDPFGLADCEKTAENAQCLPEVTVTAPRSSGGTPARIDAGAWVQSLYETGARAVRVVGAQGAKCLGNLGIMVGGTANTMTAETSIRGYGDAMEWRGKDGRWFRVSKHPNGTTGAGRNAIVASGRAARAAARRFGIAGIAVSGSQMTLSIGDGDWGEAGWHAADAFMSGVGMAGLPGLALSGAWFVGRFIAEC